MSAPRDQSSNGSSAAAQRVDVLIVGAGLSGIAIGRMLRREGITDFLIIEKADGLGGTWRHNTYPGCACDVPSVLYSMADRPNPEWSRLFAEAPEILDYLQEVADEDGVTPHMRFGVEMLESAWDISVRRWKVLTSAGDFVARLLVVATGSLHAINTAEIAGTDTFTGRIFHSAAWPAGYNGSGEKVAVIGTGASAIQLTPRLQKRARQVVVLQRNPSWIQFKPDWSHSRITKRLFRHVPVTQYVLRRAIQAVAEVLYYSLYHPRAARFFKQFALLHLWLTVRDPQLRRKLRPRFALGCKRVVVASDYYPAMTKPNVTLVDSPASRITETSVAAVDGTEHQVDAIVLATGFHYGTGPIARRVRGADGPRGSVSPVTAWARPGWRPWPARWASPGRPSTPSSPGAAS